jgi:hypothetical protein
VALADAATAIIVGIGELVVSVQLLPELVDMQMPEPDNTNVLPSAEEAAACQTPDGRLLVVQSAPELVEV